MKKDEIIENLVSENDFKKSVMKTFSENDGVYSSEEEKIRPKIVKIQKKEKTN